MISSTSQPADPGPVEPLLDHLVYAVPDLAEAVEQFERVTGVRPAEGGSHRGLGTRNCLVGLSPTSYLEIIGPDPERPPDPGVTMPFGVQDLSSPRLTAWAVHPDDIDSVAARATAAGAGQGPVRAMERVRPDGMLLRWRLAVATPPPLDGITPFLIDWGDTEHPAQGLLPDATLVSLTATCPDPVLVRGALEAMDLSLAVRRGQPSLTARVRTRRGAFLIG